MPINENTPIQWATNASILNSLAAKPEKKLGVLNVCGNSTHGAYTIPIGFGHAQCLICNVSRRVNALYTPGFAKQETTEAETSQPEFLDDDSMGDPPDEDYEDNDPDEGIGGSDELD